MRRVLTEAGARAAHRWRLVGTPTRVLARRLKVCPSTLLQQLSVLVRRALGRRTLLKPSRMVLRNRRVFELLRAGATWWEVFEELGLTFVGTTPGKARGSLLIGVLSYCRRAELPVPTRARAHLGRKPARL